MEFRRKILNTSPSKLRSKKKICKDVSVPTILIYYLQTKMVPEKPFLPSPSTQLLKTRLLKNLTDSKFPMSKELELTTKTLSSRERKHLYLS
jgi:hypothetical protein